MVDSRFEAGLDSKVCMRLPGDKHAFSTARMRDLHFRDIERMGTCRRNWDRELLVRLSMSRVNLHIRDAATPECPKIEVEPIVQRKEREILYLQA